MLLLMLLSLSGCRFEDVIGDEGVRLGKQIERAAERLRHSADTELVFDFSPRAGVDQKYSVGLGKSVWCPTPPCPQNVGGLSVVVERGNGGSTTVHLLQVGVPAPIHVEKSGEPAHVVLRKNRDTIDVVAVR